MPATLLGNIVFVYRYKFYAQEILDGVLNHFAERWWATKTFSRSKMGHETFSNCAKLSSALVPRIKNDRSLNKNLSEADTGGASYITGFLPSEIVRNLKNSSHSDQNSSVVQKTMRF